jgi:hypothetical protein
MKVLPMFAMVCAAVAPLSMAHAAPGRPAVQLAQATSPAPEPGQPAPATPPSTPTTPGKLTGMAAWNALVGNTVVGKLEGKDFADYYLADGTVKSMVGSETITGRWSLEGDKICFAYPGEPKECYAMEVSGDVAVFTDRDGMSVKGQVQKGNAKNF